MQNTMNTPVTFPVAIGPARYPNGEFAPRDDWAAVAPVIMEDGKTGFQVGPGGRIYANREHAVKYAARRLAYFRTAK